MNSVEKIPFWDFAAVRDVIGYFEHENDLSRLDEEFYVNAISEFFDDFPQLIEPYTKICRFLIDEIKPTGNKAPEFLGFFAAGLCKEIRQRMG